MAAGGPAAPDVKVKLRDTLPLRAAIPDERVNELVWPDRFVTDNRSADARTAARSAVVMRPIAMGAHRIACFSAHQQTVEPNVVEMYFESKYTGHHSTKVSERDENTNN